MKRLFAILILSVLFVQLFTKLVILIDFKLNQDFIAKNLCVKKEIENNDCEGHCCLKKSLSEAEKSESPLPNLPKEKIENIFITNISSLTSPETLLISENKIAAEVKIRNDFSPFIFHPPSVI